MLTDSTQTKDRTYTHHMVYRVSHKTTSPNGLVDPDSLGGAAVHDLMIMGTQEDVVLLLLVANL